VDVPNLRICVVARVRYVVVVCLVVARHGREHVPVGGPDIELEDRASARWRDVDVRAMRLQQNLVASVHIVVGDLGAVRMFEAVGFNTVAVLNDMVKDRTGKRRNLAIMDNDVASLGRIMEDWIQDSMVPAYRVPGAGV